MNCKVCHQSGVCEELLKLGEGGMGGSGLRCWLLVSCEEGGVGGGGIQRRSRDKTKSACNQT